ncbi:MAG TPA: cytochrome c3 family protein [Planctomycetota bacterium]|nr:cytochrome c3 family protein [Planctomycetota bacterium]
MSPQLTKLAVLGAFLIAPLAALAALRFGFDPVAHESAQPLIHRDGGFVGSNTCRACHEEHFESWERTFHHTMTQRADAQSVVGEFDGRAVSYGGKSARPILRDGRYFMELPTDTGATREAEVVLTVGSRRYQQYFEREDRGNGFAFVRLPILWHIEAKRWLHLNTVFLEPDSDNWNDHRSTWNSNCILCHNTGPQPRMLNHSDPSRFTEERFDSKVAELGISCEACHGPGEQHALAQRDPLARYEERFSTQRDPLVIVNPERIDQERSVGVCGQCHGQRMPEPLTRARDWFTSGPTYRSGERLLEHVKPITIDTVAIGSADPVRFRFRFWADGTPRLTAYEYQGTTSSPCYLKGTLTCHSCHTMHSGDVRGQLEPAMRTNQACLQCHAEIGRDVSAHTKHAADSSGSSCMECHMPRMVYGVVEIHRSHRIENPDPRRDAENGRPNACTLCHLDKSPLWAASEMTRMWGHEYPPPRSRPDKAPLELADSIASVLAGDAVQRAVYAKAMGRADSPIAAPDRAFLLAHLAVTMADAYPSIRWISQRSLAALEREDPIGLAAALEKIDHMSGQTERRDAVNGLLKLVAECSRAKLRPPFEGSMVRADFSLDREAVFRLMDLQGERVISIGE